jgi:hypothetical protein
MRGEGIRGGGELRDREAVRVGVSSDLGRISPGKTCSRKQPVEGAARQPRPARPPRLTADHETAIWADGYTAARGPGRPECPRGCVGRLRTGLPRGSSGSLGRPTISRSRSWYTCCGRWEAKSTLQKPRATGPGSGTKRLIRTCARPVHEGRASKGRPGGIRLEPGGRREWLSSCNHVARRTWAPKGETPVQRSWERHDRRAVMAEERRRPWAGDRPPVLTLVKRRRSRKFGSDVMKNSEVVVTGGRLIQEWIGRMEASVLQHRTEYGIDRVDC